jgi:hypothetical protein
MNRQSRSPKTFALVLLALLAAGTAAAGTHFGIISTVSTSPRTAARLNVTVHPGDASAATFTVFPGGSAASVQDAVAFSPEFFATSESSAVPGIQNLFTGAAGQTALVRVDVPAASSAVILEQYSPEERVVLALPPLDTIASPTFYVPIGNLHHGTSLLIGNPTGSRNAIIIRYGQGADQPPIVIAEFSVVVIPITVAHTQVAVRAADPSVPFIAQLAVDTGKTTVMTVLSPPSDF